MLMAPSACQYNTQDNDIMIFHKTYFKITRMLNQNRDAN